MTQMASLTRLTARVVPRSGFSDRLIVQLYQLYQTYYTPTDPALFAQDFHAKTWAIVLQNDQGTDVGFSTIEDRTIAINGQPVRSLFSGDTIIDHAHWGTQTLPLRWIELAGQIKAETPEVPLYWLLISKGHRTYRYLPAFTYSYAPSASPDHTANIRTALGRDRFGSAYCPDTGIVRAGAVPTRLRAEFEGAGHISHNPHARFFANANPGVAKGDELLCLCELSAENLRPRARAPFLRGLSDGS